MTGMGESKATATVSMVSSYPSTKPIVTDIKLGCLFVLISHSYTHHSTSLNIRDFEYLTVSESDTLHYTGDDGKKYRLNGRTYVCLIPPVYHPCDQCGYRIFNFPDLKHKWCHCTTDRTCRCHSKYHHQIRECSCPQWVKDLWPKD